LHIYRTSISHKHSKAPTTIKDIFIHKTFLTENHSGMVLVGAEAITSHSKSLHHCSHGSFIQSTSLTF